MKNKSEQPSFLKFKDLMKAMYFAISIIPFTAADDTNLLFFAAAIINLAIAGRLVKTIKLEKEDCHV